MVKIIGLVVSVVKMILNVKKWINTVYRVWKMCRDRPWVVVIGVVVVVVLIWINVN
tara:strand:- start:33 stop:200 length:168 start_codon:yes stop_codon:yes gene_type:complete